MNRPLRWKRPGNLPVEQEIIKIYLTEGEDTEELDKGEEELEDG